MNSQFVFSHPNEYRIIGVAGRGAYAIVCKADVIDRDAAERMGLLDPSLSRQATSVSGQYCSDVVHDAPNLPQQQNGHHYPAQESPLQLMQREASALLVHTPSHYMQDVQLLNDDGDGSSTNCLGGVSGLSVLHGASGASGGSLMPANPVEGDDEAAVATAADGERQEEASSGITTGSSHTVNGNQVLTGDGRDAAPSYGTVAIKQLLDHASVGRAVSDAWRTHYLRKVCREVEIVLHFNSVPQIINMCDLYLSANHRDVYIVMPYVEHNLHQIIRSGVTLQEPMVRWLVCQILLGLRALHNAGVIHRDLSPSNVLVNTDTWDACIADFGLSRARESSDAQITLEVVTLPYRAPEVLLEFSQYTDLVDVWALGCIIAEAFLKAPFLQVDPAKNPDTLKQLKEIIKFAGFPRVDDLDGMASPSNVTFLRNWAAQLGSSAPAGRDIGDELARRGCSDISPEALAVMRAALQFNPAYRATPEQLLRMPWFQDDEQCAQLIAICDQLDQPGPCPTDVERMDFSQLLGFLNDTSMGRRANIDSYVSEMEYR